MSPMRLRQWELGLRFVQWTLCAGIIWVCLGATLLRRPLPKAKPTDVASGQLPQARGSPAVALEDLKSIWERDLRQELHPPKPKEEPKPLPAPAPPAVKLPRLQATFVEAGQAWGLFSDASGNQRVRTAGERIDEFEIVGIRPGDCTLRKGEQAYELRVPENQVGRPRGPGPRN
jgi:hypothetical protein